MPQDSLLPGDPPPLYRVRIEIVDHTLTLLNRTNIHVAVSGLDQAYESLVSLSLHGHGRDFTATTVEDLVHAFQYEDRRAIVLTAQQNERLARKHQRHHERSGL